MLVAAGAALVVSNPASAQGRCFEVIDLGEIGVQPFAEVGGLGPTEPFAINNDQQVVFNVDTGTQKRAYLFLQTAAFGLVPGCHDLHALAGFASEQDSGVHDINDAGLAVGWATFQGEQHAVVWRIDLHDENNVPPIPFDDLGLLDLVESTYSAAFAINDEDPPIIVGEGDVKGSCTYGADLDHLVPRGYWVAFTDPPPLLAPDAIRLVHNNVPQCKPITSTRDVNTVAAAGQLAPTVAAGISTETATGCFGAN